MLGNEIPLSPQLMETPHPSNELGATTPLGVPACHSHASFKFRVEGYAFIEYL